MNKKPRKFDKNTISLPWSVELMLRDGRFSDAEICDEFKISHEELAAKRGRAREVEPLGVDDSEESKNE